MNKIDEKLCFLYQPVYNGGYAVSEGRCLRANTLLETVLQLIPGVILVLQAYHDRRGVQQDNSGDYGADDNRLPDIFPQTKHFI